MRQRIFAIFVVLVLALASASSGRAADLRVDFVELARVVQALVGNATVRLHNAPGGLFEPGANVTVASFQKLIPIKVASFDLQGSTYAFYVNDLSSTEVRATAANGALRLTIKFEDEGPEIIGGCLAGSCLFENALPNIEWSDPGITVDMVPVRFNGSVSLNLKRVELLGTLTPVCKTDIGIIAANTCRLIALPRARQKIALLRGQIDDGMKKVNEGDMQQHLADQLKPRLSLGTLGEVQISNVAVDPEGIIVSFRLGSAQ